jgi:hypothetical protein
MYGILFPMKNAAKQKQIREFLDAEASLEGLFLAPKPKSSLSFSLYSQGLPKGALTQLLGPGSTEVLLRLFSEHPSKKFAWVEKRLTAFPPGFVERGANLNLLLFVEGGEELPWALTQVLLSRIFEAVVLASPLSGERAELQLRRLQLAAERSGTALILAAESDGPSWPFKLRLEASQKEGYLSLRNFGRQAFLEALG